MLGSIENNVVFKIFFYFSVQNLLLSTQGIEVGQWEESDLLSSTIRKIKKKIKIFFSFYDEHFLNKNMCAEKTIIIILCNPTY